VEVMDLGISLHIHTDTVDFELDLWAQEFVPFVNGVDQIAAAFEGTGAAEGVCERGIGCKVGVDCFSLTERGASQQDIVSIIILIDVVPVQQASPGIACARRR
jgi:hypothetical protein